MPSVDRHQQRVQLETLRTVNKLADLLASTHVVHERGGSGRARGDNTARAAPASAGVATANVTVGSPQGASFAFAPGAPGGNSGGAGGAGKAAGPRAKRARGGQPKLAALHGGATPPHAESPGLPAPAEAAAPAKTEPANTDV